MRRQLLPPKLLSIIQKSNSVFNVMQDSIIVFLALARQVWILHQALQIHLIRRQLSQQSTVLRSSWPALPIAALLALLVRGGGCRPAFADGDVGVVVGVDVVVVEKI